MGRDIFHGSDHVVSREVAAVVELDAPAQFELERGVVDPRERFRQMRLDLVCFVVAIDQRVPDMVPEHDAFADRMGIEVDARRHAVRCPDQRIIAWSGLRSR